MIQSVQIPAGKIHIEGDLEIPSHPLGLVLFAHGSGSSRKSPRNRHVAEILHGQQIATLLFDLLTPEEDSVYQTRFNIALLADRLLAATRWVGSQKELRIYPLGYFGASTGAAAALVAAAEAGDKIHALVSRGGRPDLAGSALKKVKAPTLLIVGGYDETVIHLNREAFEILTCEKEMEIVPGATHLFEEPGKIDEVAQLATQWFLKHFFSHSP